MLQERAVSAVLLVTIRNVGMIECQAVTYLPKEVIRTEKTFKNIMLLHFCFIEVKRKEESFCIFWIHREREREREMW